MTIFEIYSYWNLNELELVFNAVASIVGSSSFLGLLRTLAVVAILSIAMAVLAGFSQLPEFGRWLIMLAIFNGMLLVPKVDVILIDRTGTEASRTVANVPLGLAAFAHSTSHIGDWLTRTFETTFSLPDDIQFRSHGTLFGHRVQEEILHTKFDSSILTSNLMEFYRECIVPEFSTGYIVASEMAKSNDIWGYLNGKTNPGRLVTIRKIPGETTVNSNTYNCADAYTNLGTQINYVNNAQMSQLGRRLYPGLPTATASNVVKGAIETSTNYILGISTTAADVTRQAALSNFMIDAQYMLPAQLGDAAGAAANLAQAQAIRSTNESYKLMAKMGQSTMPKVKNIIELVQYAIFPIIIIMILLAGHKGGMVAKAYIMSLLWVQLWPPLYAVMHLIMTMHAAELAAITNGAGLSMSEFSRVGDAYISDQAIAGMIATVGIPAIAAAIIKGGEVGMSAFGSAITSPTQQASQAASAAAQGNFSMGNASLSSQSAHNLNMGKIDAQPSYKGGEASVTHVGKRGTVEQVGDLRTVSAGGASVVIDTKKGQILSASLPGVAITGSSASISFGRHASSVSYSDQNVKAEQGKQVTSGTSQTASISDNTSAATTRQLITALNELLGTGMEYTSGQSSGNSSSVSRGTSGEKNLINKESLNADGGVGVNVNRQAGGEVVAKPKEEQPEDPLPADQASPSTSAAQPRNAKMRELINAIIGNGPSAANTLNNSNMAVGANAGLKVSTGQTYNENAKQIIAQASESDIREAYAILAKASHHVAATTNDAGVKQAAKALEANYNRATTLDDKELRSLAYSQQAGNRQEEGTDNRNAVTVDNSVELFRKATKMLFGEGFNVSTMTPEKLSDLQQEWVNNQGFRNDVALAVRSDMDREQETTLRTGTTPIVTQQEVANTGKAYQDVLMKQWASEVNEADKENKEQVSKKQYAAPGSSPDLKPAAAAYRDAAGVAEKKLEHTESQVVLESGINIVAQALYQDRQKGMSTVIGNTYFGGAGSANMLDYQKALQEAAKKDPELAQGLAVIADNQKRGHEPTKEEIQWVVDKAGGAVQKKEGVVSEVLHKLNEAGYALAPFTRPTSTPPSKR